LLFDEALRVLQISDRTKPSAAVEGDPLTVIKVEYDAVVSRLSFLTPVNLKISRHPKMKSEETFGF
jgi:hypothetical protein